MLFWYGVSYLYLHFYSLHLNPCIYILPTDTDAESGDSDDEFHQRAGDEKDFQGRVSIITNCLLAAE